MSLNNTTPHVSPLKPQPQIPGYYVLILFVLLILAGCAVAATVYVRRRARSLELRHRLIARYSYDPTEGQEDWGGTGREEEELAEPLCREGSLSFPSGYGT